CQTCGTVADRHQLGLGIDRGELTLESGIGGRAWNHRDTLAGEIRELVELAIRPGEHTTAVDEDRQAEVDALVARERHRRRAAFDVHFARCDGVEARARFERAPFDFECGKPELFLEARRDARAKLDTVTADLAVAFLERKRRRAGAIAQVNHAVGANAVQCARWAGGRYRSSK